MQFEDKGTNPATPQVSESFAASVANIGETLTALVDRMEAEVAVNGIVSRASAGELRQVRYRAEHLFGVSPDVNS